ncbi:MAG TPA: tetratricopeptide repeat protein [Burkholderiaceae bacterium]
MRRFVLPASLMCAILLTVGALAALKPVDGASPSTSPALERPVQTRVSTQSPVDAAGWQALGRSESAQGQHAQAVVAFRNATRLRPDDATLLAEYAFSAAVTTRRTEADDPQRLIDMALQIDPTSQQALTLAGSLALDRGDFESAAQNWERLARLEPADSPMRREVEASAAQARRLANAHAAQAAQLPPEGRIQLARAELRARPRQ